MKPFTRDLALTLLPASIVMMYLVFIAKITWGEFAQ